MKVGSLVHKGFDGSVISDSDWLMMVGYGVVVEVSTSLGFEAVRVHWTRPNSRKRFAETKGWYRCNVLREVK